MLNYTTQCFGHNYTPTLLVDVELRREEQAAVTIQCAVRRLLAKRELVWKQKKKQDYEDLMEHLEKEVSII